MDILLTGAGGYIGLPLARKLIANGHNLTIVGRNPVPNLDGAKFVQADIRDANKLSSAAGCYDRVYHLAGMITFNPAEREQLLSVNEGGTRIVSSLAAKWGCERLIYVSSACTVGISRTPHRLDESSRPDQAQVARNPYMESKIAGEKAAFEAAGAMRVVSVNPTTVCGPGDYTLNSGTLFAKVSRAKALPVPGGGSNMVDIDDVLEGILHAGEKGKSGERYILGNENLPFQKIFGTIAAAIGCHPFLIPLPSVAKYPLSLAVRTVSALKRDRFLTPQIVEDLFRFKYYDCAKARRELGWEPKFDFAGSAARAWKFYKEEGLI